MQLYRKRHSIDTVLHKVNGRLHGDLADILEEDVRVFCKNVVTYSEILLKKKGRYATKQLYRSLQYRMSKVQKDGESKLRATVSANAKAKGNRFRYGNTIGYGFRADAEKVPVDPEGIRAWVKAKRIKGWKRRVKDSSGQYKDTDNILSEEQISRLITASLLKRGRFEKLAEDGDRFFHKAFNKHIKDLRPTIEKHVKKNVTKYINEVFGK